MVFEFIFLKLSNVFMGSLFEIVTWLTLVPALRFRPNAFEVIGVDGSTSGVVHCSDTQSLTDWIQCINHNILLLNHQNVSTACVLLQLSQLLDVTNHSSSNQSINKCDSSTTNHSSSNFEKIAFTSLYNLNSDLIHRSSQLSIQVQTNPTLTHWSSTKHWSSNWSNWSIMKGGGAKAMLVSLWSFSLSFMHFTKA